MNKNIENIDRYLKGVVPPEHISHQHQQQLRREVLGKIERRQTMSVRVKSWKYAAVIALICTGIAAAVVGIKIHKWRFVEKDPERGYLLRSEDGRSGINIPESLADNPEHAVQTAEELDLLKEQGVKELVSAEEIEVDGQLDSRLLGYEYTFSDGRTVLQVEDDPDIGQGTLAGEHKDEATRLRKEALDGSMAVDGDGGHFLMTAEGEVLPNYKRVVHGRVFSFSKLSFVLSDGTQVTWSIGQPSKESQSNSAEAEQARSDLQEIAMLSQQDKRRLIGVNKLVANDELDSRVFVYQYQLSDGRTSDMRESAGGNYILSKAQRQEWIQHKDAGSGEDLGTYEEKVEGRVFVFKRQRFALSDGTEIIWSRGTPKDSQ